LLASLFLAVSMPQILKINQFCFAFPAFYFCRFRFIPATDSDLTSKSGCHHPEWVADMLRIRWSTCFGITGRFAPEYAKTLGFVLAQEVDKR